MIFKLGKKAARPDSIILKLRDYLTPSVLPSIPVSGGHQGLVSAWGMYGNDRFGDCVLAGAAHETMQWNKERGVDVGFTDTSVLSDYSAITGFDPSDPSTDEGTDMQLAASYRRKTGVLDATGIRHKIMAYLALQDTKDIRAAVYLFGACGIGIKFPASAMKQFQQNKPWTVVLRSKIQGGHYVPALYYDAKYLYVVTWGRAQPVAWSFIKKYMDEAVVYLTEEMFLNGKSLEGFDLVQLQSDLTAFK